jgi:hypothetical protein
MKKLVLIGEGRDVVSRGGLLYPDAGRVQYWNLVDEAARPPRTVLGTKKTILGPGPLLASRRLSTAELDREELRLRLRIAAGGGACAPRRRPAVVQTLCPRCFSGVRLTTAYGPCPCGALVDRRGRVVA